MVSKPAEPPESRQAFRHRSPPPRRFATDAWQKMLLETAMLHPFRFLPATATLAALALVAGTAQAAGTLRGEQYAMFAPRALQAEVPRNVTKMTRSSKQARKAKGKKILSGGLTQYRMPAQRALAQIKRTPKACQPDGPACPAVFHESLAKSQAWRDAAVALPPTSFDRRRDAQAETRNFTPPADDPTDTVPGRASHYQFTLNVPIGRDENVVLEARLRRNPYNAEGGSDSTLRADWSVRF